MSLGELLIDDLSVAIAATPEGISPSVLLWFDAVGEWRRPVAAISPQLSAARMELLTLDPTGSQVGAKFQLLSRTETARTLVYLPGWSPRDLTPDGGARPKLWSVVDYVFTGVVWSGSQNSQDGPTIADWLAGQGVRLAGGPPAQKRLMAGSGESKLSRWLARVLDRDVGDLPEHLRESDVVGVLGGEATSAIVDLLLDPERAFRTWADDAPDVLDRVRDRFGLAIPANLPPEGVADGIAADLALTEAWDAFGRSPDFPFLARLPSSETKRSDVAKFVRHDLLRRADVAHELLVRVSAQEPSFHELITWSVDRAGNPLALPELAHARWLLVIEKIAARARDGWRSTQPIFESEAMVLGSPAETPSVPGVPSTSWAGLRRLRDIIVTAVAAIEQAPTLSVDGLVYAYTKNWWHMDDDYLAFRREADRYPALAPIRLIADDAYADYLEASAARWTGLLEAEPNWAAPIRSVREIASDVWRATEGHRATLIIDAVRWDVAKALEGRIGPGCQVEPVLSTLPSTTPFGMSALLPLTEAPSVSIGPKGVSLHVGKNEISSREGRKTFLTEWFQAQGRTVAFLELDDVLHGAKVPSVDHVVVFNYALDQTGHAPATAANLPTEVEANVARIELAIRQLHRTKIRRVDVVTDHGFLYVEPTEVDSLGRPKVVAANTLNRGPRYALLKADAPAPDLFRIEAPLVPGSYVGLPRGIRTLVQAELYEHGGVSLQECVIPHLVSESAAVPETLEVQVTPSTTQLSGGTVAVTVRPAGSAQMTLGAPTRRRLRLWLEAPGPDGKPSEVSDPLECEVRSDSPELRQALYLREDAVLPAGTRVLLRARDVDTLADLSESALTLLVDWG